MSLIKCLECGREISDKASVCIHCGCPIINTPKEISYKIIVTYYRKNNSKGSERFILKNVLNLSFTEQNRLIDNIPYTILERVSETNKKYLSQKFMQLGIDVDFIKQDVPPDEELNDKIFDYIVDTMKVPDPRPPKCPKCGCKELTVTSRGYDLLLGFIGSSKPYNVCNKCGYRWEVGKKE